MAAKKAAATASQGLEKLCGIKVPTRIATFLDGPEVKKYDGAHVWGIEGFSADTKLKVQFASKKLRTYMEYAEDFDEGEGFLPIAALGSETYMLAVDPKQSDLPAFFFDYEAGWKPFADSFDSMLGKLLKKGEKSPVQKLEGAYKKAKSFYEKKKYKEAIAELEPIFALFPKKMSGGLDETEDTLGAAYNIAGICYEKLEKIEQAIEMYRIGYDLGASSAALNVCDLWLNHFKDPKKLVEYAESIKGEIYGFSDEYGWFHIRNYLGQGYLLLGDRWKAERNFHDIKSRFQTSDVAKVEESIKDLRELAKEKNIADATVIADWMEAKPPAPPAERIAELRAWFKKLPDAVKEVLRKAASFEKEPSDVELGRIAMLDDIDMEGAKLKSIEWITALDRLEKVDLEGTGVKDLSPLAKLTRLRSVNVEENGIDDLSPIPMRKLERLNAGENAIESLEPLREAKQLSYLHIPKNKIASIEPLRGLPELSDVTVYDNKIDDISPIVDCPRLTSLGYFSNPTKEILVLAKCERLERVNLPHGLPDEEEKALKNALPWLYVGFGVEGDPPTKEWMDATRAWWNGLDRAWKSRFAKKFDKDEQKKPEPSDSALVELLQEDSLHLDDEELGSLAPLSKFVYLRYLAIQGSGVTDLSPLAPITKLRDLVMRRNPITSFASASKLTALEEIYADRCQLTSLDGLEHCPKLRELYMDDCRIGSLDPIANAKELRVVSFDGNRIESLAPLKNATRLRKVMIAANRVTDLSPLAGCEDLESIECYANPGIRGASALVHLQGLVKIISHGCLPASEIDEIRKKRPEIEID